MIRGLMMKVSYQSWLTWNQNQCEAESKVAKQQVFFPPCNRNSTAFSAQKILDFILETLLWLLSSAALPSHESVG